MEVLMLIGAISFCGFMLMCIENMRIFHLSTKKSVIAVVAFVVLGQLPLPMGEFISVPIAVVFLMIMYKSFSKAIMMAIYVTALLLGFLSATTLLVNLLDFSDRGWSVNLLNRDFDIEQIFVLSVAAGFVVLFFILQRFLKKRIDMNIFNNRMMHSMLVSASAVLVLIYIGYVAPDTYIGLGQWSVNFEDIANILFFLSSVIMFVIILWYVSKETAIKTEKLLIEASNKYIHDLEESYNALRTIKHDYVNILSSFKLYIDSKDIGGLAKYYYDELSEMNKDLLHQDRLIGDLQNVQLNEIKSVMIYKGSVAARHEVDVSVEVREPVESIGASTAIACQILGILLDNAIEAAALAEERKIKIAIVKNSSSKAFIIKNTWIEQDIPINKLFDLGFSTKGESRGTGLHTVRNYTDKIKGLHLETEITDEYFSQILTVKDA